MEFNFAMFIHDIPENIIILIMSFIKDNKSVINFASTCTDHKRMLYNYGYLKHMTYSPLNSNIYDFSIQISKHHRTLQSISLSHVPNPQLWIPYWPKLVYLNWCYIKNILSPTTKVDTETLYILYDKNDYIFINWKMFPRLKKLVITGDNFNRDDDSKPKDLELVIRL